MLKSIPTVYSIHAVIWCMQYRSFLFNCVVSKFMFVDVSCHHYFMFICTNYIGLHKTAYLSFILN